MTNAATMALRYDPEDLREIVVRGGAQDFADGLIKALKPKIDCPLCKQQSGYNRWAFNLFGKISKLVQADTMVLVAVMDRIGVKSEIELRELVEHGKELRKLRESGISVEEAALEAGEVLRLAQRDRPDLVARILDTLSHAEVEHSPGSNGSMESGGTDEPPAPRGINGSGQPHR